MPAMINDTHVSTRTLTKTIPNEHSPP